MATQGLEIERRTPSVDWGAVIAGAAGAAAISVLLAGFGTALGLSMTSARPFAGVSGTTFAIVAGLWFALVQVGSFYAGGYVTGRMRRAFSASEHERHFRDGVHGFLVWAVGTLVGAYFLASTASSITSKVVDVAGQAAQTVGQAAGQIAGQGAVQATASPENRQSIQSSLSYYADRLFRRAAGGPGAAPAPQAPANPPQDRATATAEASRILAMSLYNDRLDPNDKTYLASIVASQAGMSQDDAAKRVDEVFTSAQNAKNQAIAKARDAAETARHTSVLAAFLAAAVSLAALVAATAGAAAGGTGRDENSPTTLMGAGRLW